MRYICDHYIAPYKIAHVLSKDIKNLKNLGLNGFISCQVQRTFFPNGLGMLIMGKMLWNCGLSFEELVKEYFSSTYGEDGELCRQYVVELSKLFDIEYINGKKDIISEEYAERFRKITGVIDGFRPIITKNLNIYGNYINFGMYNNCISNIRVYYKKSCRTG